MAQINQLSAVSKLQLGDLLAIFSTNNGDARKASLSVLLEFIQENLGTSLNYITQREVIANTGFNINVASNGQNIWLIMNLTGAFAAGAITLPPLAEAIDGQEVQVFSTRQVTTFTVNGNGAVDVLGEPSSLAAESFFTLRFDAGSNSWYRVA